MSAVLLEAPPPGDGSQRAARGHSAPCCSCLSRCDPSEQQNDPTLIEMFQQVRPVEEMESVAHGYFLEEGMLVRKWLPQELTERESKPVALAASVSVVFSSLGKEDGEEPVHNPDDCVMQGRLKHLESLNDLDRYQKLLRGSKWSEWFEEEMDGGGNRLSVLT
ncbi:hypothetical protein N1851_022726 [Merluccius polli]|uniref:Uncharacterized protein n=1 Tax=Merluccius polli TaxID=89951 RepID=A0AA47MHR8_MERPO|nr:hypothetical protein N1851_022726 [Merluccius polli]